MLNKNVSLSCEPFGRMSAKLDIFTEGLGLGLYLCHRIVNLMGGSLTLDTQHTPGSRFVLSLRLTPSA
jgi:signal transduction histidine kinase